MVKRIWAGGVILALVSCSSATLSGEGKKTEPFQEQTYLTLVGFAGSIVKREKRFSGYSKTAGRVSLIDPSREREVWGRQIEGTYDLTTPLPDYSGVAVLSGSHLKLVSPDTERDFAEIPFAIGFTARAADTATYAFVAQDGQSFHVVRQLADGSYQEETFASPLAVPPNFSTPPGEEPPPAVALLSGKGDRLVFFRPSDGAYAYYAADSAEGRIAAAPKRQCSGVPQSGDGLAEFRALAFDDDSSLMVAGDRHGTVSTFDPAAACVAPADRPKQLLGDKLAIIDVTVSAPGRIAVTQVGGRLHTLGVSLAGFEDVRTIEDVCRYPLGALPVGENGMALVCVDAQDLESTEELEAAPATVKYQNVSVQLVSLVSGLGIYQRPLDVDQTAGAALDPDLGRVLVLKDSAIGVLTVLDLTTGDTHTTKGLFLDGILD